MPKKIFQDGGYFQNGVSPPTGFSQFLSLGFENFAVSIEKI
jgi:hypothetical protein